MENKVQVYREKATVVLSVILVMFHVYTALFGMLESVQQRSFCLTLILCIIFLSKPSTLKGVGPVLDLVLIAMSVGATAHIFFDWSGIITRGGRYTTMEVVLAALFILALVEAGRRCLGMGLTTISIIALAYNIWGNSIPVWNLGFRKIAFSRIAYNLVYTTEGVYSTPFGSVATFVIVFLLFAELMDATGAREFLMDFALMVFGKKRGGAAKVAVISSGLFGMVSGSSVANVVSTGVITIPLMKRSGFKAHVAGAIEACASTGGMLAPPIMGATAFVMAEVLGVSYLEVIKAAAIPAILYYAAIYLYIEFKTQDGQNSYIVAEDELGVKDVDKKSLIKRLMIVFVPIVFLVVFMNRWSVQKAVMAAAALMVVLAVIFKSYEGLKHPVTICKNTGKHALSVAMATALGGVVVGVINFTSLGFKISNMLITISGDSLLLLCVLAMLASIIFGMGLPPTACYIMVAMLVAPVMVDRGVPLMAAHLFALYFGILSNITPPVAVASFAAAPIAEEKPMKVGWMGFIIMMVLCLIPYGFVYYPAMLLGDGYGIGSILVSVVTISITIALGAVSIAGYLFRVRLSALERVILIVLTLLVFSPAVPIYGNLALFAAVLVFYWFRSRRLTPASA